MGALCSKPSQSTLPRPVVIHPLESEAIRVKT